MSLKFEDEGLGSFQDDGSRAWSSPVWVICPSYPDLSLRLVSSKDLLERRLRGRPSTCSGGGPLELVFLDGSLVREASPPVWDHMGNIELRCG